MLAGIPRLRRIPPVLLACLLAIVACKSPQEKLLERRQTLRAKLDALHAKYVASAATEDSRAEPEGDGAAGPGAGLVRRFVEEFDRSQLEGYCLASGRGERAFALSSRLEAFVREAANAETCREAARLEAEIAALERELSADRGGAPR